MNFNAVSLSCNVHFCIILLSSPLTEDEHDVVWFWLEKDKPHECPVCSQYFVVSSMVNLELRILILIIF